MTDWKQEIIEKVYNKHYNNTGHPAKPNVCRACLEEALNLAEESMLKKYRQYEHDLNVLWESWVNDLHDEISRLKAENIKLKAELSKCKRGYVTMTGSPRPELDREISRLKAQLKNMTKEAREIGIAVGKKAKIEELGAERDDDSGSKM